MPYVHPNRRDDLDSWDRARSSGDLNYQITSLLTRYLKHHGLSYQTCNDIVGALENAKHEFQRRIQDPYEDEKIRENGDVYEDFT